MNSSLSFGILMSAFKICLFCITRETSAWVLVCRVLTIFNPGLTTNASTINILATWMAALSKKYRVNSFVIYVSP